MERHCRAVSTALFGAQGAADDRAEAPGEPAFFSGNAENYDDPANSFVDKVLANRRGSPISLSLVYKACASRLGTELVGLNAPSHMLLAPAADRGLWATGGHSDDLDLLAVDPLEGTLLLETTGLATPGPVLAALAAARARRVP